MTARYDSPNDFRRGDHAESQAIPDYLIQSDAVRERFARLKARDVILDVRHVGKRFRTPQGDTVALHDISFTTHRREFVCVIGPSGCGKSTLIRILAGLEAQTSGDVLLDGKPVRGPGADRGMVFQGYTLFPWLTVKKNVMFGLRMDEPFGALDAQTRAKMQTHLLDIWRNIDVTILFMTHDLDEAILLADRILVLKAHPGEVQELIEVPVPVPRPRGYAQVNTQAFVATKARREALIHPQGEGDDRAAGDPAAGDPPRPHMIRMTDVTDNVE